jgi:murein DD-endopeptidase MepM/ murein hydrolase activator NlpD
VHPDFDIAAFDPHPAFRVPSGRRCELPPQDPRPPMRSVWPLPALEGIAPTLGHLGDNGVMLHAAAVRSPAFVPVFAVRDGVIVYAGAATDAHAIVIDHGDDHRSFYWGLSHAFVLATNKHQRKQRVNVGDVLGYVSPSSSSGASLHFAIMKRDSAGHLAAIDPEAAMRSWPVLSWSDDHTNPPACQPIAA